MISEHPVIVWFRQDLRLRDNSALARAVETGAPVIPVFIWAPEEAGDWAPGGASRWWLHRALEAFAEQWAELGGRLILRRGDSLDELRDLIARSGAGRVYWNRRYEKELRETDAEIKRALRGDGLEARSFNSALLNEPHAVSTGEGRPYKVYTPYWKAVKDREVDPPDHPDLDAIRFPAKWPRAAALDALELLPEIRWHEKLEPHWTPGEPGARRRFEAFLDGPVDAYDASRNRPDEDGTSRLSPHLRWGHLGPREVVDRLQSACDMRRKGPFVFLKEVYWREFAHNVLYHFPDTPDRPLRREFDDFPWRRDPEVLKAWRMGRTGYPIVDAGMRQLWDTGWMHNRARMIVSSLLVKHLLHSWRDGAKWFWDTLVDADLANNTLGWQWSGGCGADAAPYFRIFNPMIQGQKFDPEGAYVRRFVPELRELPDEHIHTPWEAPAEALEAADVRLGETYPEPIIDHREGRERALEAFEAVKKE